MAEYRSDPELEPGTTALCAIRTQAGVAHAWAPGGDADAYVAHVGREYLAVVDGKVYTRDTASGNLYPHELMSYPHIAIRCVGGDPIYLLPDAFKTMWATVTGSDGIPKSELLHVEHKLAAARADLVEALEARDAAEEEAARIEREKDAVIEDLTDQLAKKQAELDDLWADYIGAPKNDTPVVPPATDESSQHPGPETAAPADPDAGAPRKGGKR